MQVSATASFVSSLRPCFTALATLALCVSPLCIAETIYTDQNKLFGSARQITTLGPSLFGDKVNLYTGTLEFVQEDVSLPGNSRLPVSVGRRLVAGQEARGMLFGGWDLEIPHLHGIYSSARGWVPLSGNAAARCSNFSQPPAERGSFGSLSSWNGTEFWHGSFLYVPGIGDQELLRRSAANTIAPVGNSYPIVTNQNWQIRCLPSMATGNGGAGEAFLAVAPDGTEYRFDWMVTKALPNLEKSNSAPEFRRADTLVAGEPSPDSPGRDLVTTMTVDGNVLARKEVWILPTRITDRFGNSVTYTYDTTNKWQLKTIVGDDGSGIPRTITFTYLTPGSTASSLVSTVSDGTRTWTYRYGAPDGRGPLQSVTLPDNSAWQLGGLSALNFDLSYLGDGNCDEPGMVAPYALTGSATHPSGASGEFVVSPVRHGRVGVPQDCMTYLEPYAETARYPKQFDTYALTKKTITGPGLAAMTWHTSYSPAISSWAPWDGRDGTKEVEVRDPEGHLTRHTFGTAYMQTEGQLQLVEQIDGNQGLLRRTATQYTQPILPRGSSDQRRGDGEMAARVYEVNRREIIQQGTAFVWEASAFNEFAQPIQIKRTSDQGLTRHERTTYRNNLSKWVLGQVETVTETSTNTELLRNGYNDATANLESVARFSLPEKTIQYHANGNIFIERDGLNHETRYTNYQRGIPQNIVFADGKAVSAVVNNLGGLDSVTGATGATTSFYYDAMGRFRTIAYPGGDAVAWNHTALSFEQVWTPEFDLGPGHWRQTITTGSGVEINYFDGFWRPVVAERRDNDDPTMTRRIVKHQYDNEGRSTFDAYPVRNEGGPNLGIRRQYDALGRLMYTEADSEHGPLRSTVWYNPSAFQKVQTDALNHATTYAFQVFDQPSEDAITNIRAPEEVTIAIDRDLFGKTKSITRSGRGKSLTRSYNYDQHHRLVRTIEPETGATLLGYDAASNVVCRATGRSLLSATACDEANVPLAKRTRFDYDVRNRLTTTAYGDGSPAIGRSYTADGLPETVSSAGSVWAYEYNNRRLNTAETLAYAGRNYRFGHVYDANGFASQLQYPFNLTLLYAPNAFGEPRRIGGFASGIQYHPNGAVATFTYGNGVRHELRQNVRGLPERATDAGILDESYAYDANANVKQITDELERLATRTMYYDELDRLHTVSAPNLWGTANYGYDSIDNLVASSISGGANARNLVHAINPETNRLGSIAGGPANFNFGYGYDDQGNVTQRGAQIYRFDQGNRMTVAEGRATYAYDGLGRRFSTVGTNQVNTLQIYSQAGKLLYSGPTDGSGTKYIYLNNHLIAETK